MSKDFAEVIRVANILDRLPVPWFIAGGYAIDLFLGRITREHQDVDICVFRDTLPDLLHSFPEWEKCIIEPSNKSALVVNSVLFQPSPSQHELHLKKGDEKLEFLLISRADNRVLFRRDQRISIAMSDFKKLSIAPFVAPEWQLLFKSKEPREKDELDFQNCLPFLNFNQREWLLNALKVVLPESPWIAGLKKRN